MKKVVSILLCVVMVLGLLPMAAFADAATVELTVTPDNAEPKAGETVVFTVAVGPVSALGAAQAYVVIPTGLTVVKAEPSAALNTDFKTNETTVADNTVGYLLGQGPEAGLTATGKTTLFTITCTVDAGVHGEKTPTFMETEQYFTDLSDKLGTSFTTTTSATSVNIPKTSYVTPYTLTFSYGTLEITDTTAKSVEATISGVDAESDALPASEMAKVTYAFKGTAPAGLSLDAKSGKVTVTDAAKAASGTVTVTATLGTATADATITVNKAASAVTEVLAATDNPSAALIPTEEESASYIYAVKVLDQYGAEMNDQTVTWTAGTLPTGVTFDADTATLTVSKDSEGGEVTLTATVGEKTLTIKVLVTDIAFTGVDAGITATDGVYGAKMSDLVKIDASKLTATAGSEVKGAYTLVDADTVPNVPENDEEVPYTVTFTSTDGTYKDIVVASGTVKVAPKTITVTANDVTVKKGDEMPERTDENFGYTFTELEGTDELGGTATYTFYNLDDEGKITTSVASSIDTDVVNEYAIVVSGLTAPNGNYTVVFADTGRLIVRKKTIASNDVVGNRTEPSGSNTTTQPDGTKVITTVADDGTVTAEVTLPSGLEKTNVTIHVKDVDPDAVAVIVADDGTETPVKFSIATDDGVAMILDQSAKIKIVGHDHDFEDTADHWAEPNVRFVHARNIFNGTSETTFSPDAAMTRSMIATVLYRLDGENKSDVAAAFEDVAADTWYTEGVAWAAEQGIVKGLSDTVFAPEENVTREQLATMIYRYVGEPAVENAKAFDSYADGDSVSDWADSAMRWAVLNGIINGKDGRVLDPQGNATRAEVATILQRFVTLQVK